MSITGTSDTGTPATTPGSVPRRRRRRLTGLLAAGAALSVVLTGCIGGGGQEAEQGSEGEQFAGEIEWWTINLQKNYADYISGMIEQYETEHPEITINWVDVPGQDITTKLLAAIAGGQVPDAVNFNSQTTGLFDDSMTDLRDHFTEAELGIYLDTLREPLVDEDGEQVGLPWYNGGSNLATYRTSVVSEAGFDPENPPETWDDALELAQAVHDETGVHGTNLLPYSWVMQSEGIELITPEGDAAAFDTPEAAELMNKYKEYYDSGAIAPGSIGQDERSYQESLENEQIAFYASVVSSQLLNVENNAPEVYEDIAVAPPVTGPEGTNLLLAQQAFGIPAASDNKAAAAEWLKFVTSPQNQLEFCKLVAIYPSTPETLEDPFFTDITGSTPADEARRVLVEGFETIEDASLGSGNDEQLRDLFDEQVRAFISGDATAEEALQTAAEQWDAELAAE